MPSVFWLSFLQWSITLSGVGLFFLAGHSWLLALHERRILKRTGHNGVLRASALNHLVCSSTRLFAASLSICGGFALTLLPDFALVSGVIAGCAWLMYNGLLMINLGFEWWMHDRMVTLTRDEVALTQVDELVALERTAERLERTAERLERAQERDERSQERQDRKVL